jgi:outer membrane receptor protein involved in Fe transport
MRSVTWPLAALLAVSASLLAAPPAANGQEPSRIEQLSLEQLMDLPVVSVSRTAERLGEAPATVIVLGRRDLADRGYGDLSELLDDLPGMDVVRPRGATIFKTYWRGFRNNVGSPYLLLVDGVVMNHLYFGTDDVLVAMPLSDVERVEVVYGPASAVYGANAFCGVVSVITGATERTPSGGGRLRAAAGETSRRGIDGTWRQPLGAWTLSLAARAADADLDSHGADGYAYTDGRLLADRGLWGGFVDDPRLAGELASPERHRAVDLRAVHGAGGPTQIEAAAQYFRTLTGYGYEYAFDASQPRAVWWRGDWSAYVRLRRELGVLTSTSLVRWRRSTVEDDSTFLEGFVDLDRSPPQRVVRFSRWDSDNDSLALAQDLELHVRDGAVTLLGGASWESRDLQKAYEIAYGEAVPPALLAPDTYRFPGGDETVGPARNRLNSDLVGVYGEAKWRLAPDHGVHMGVRWDHGSVFGSATTLRAGYAGSFGRWGVKALYGEGYQEPNQRVLFGGWRGSGSDPTLDPERARTFETAVTLSLPQTHHLLSLWQMDDYDTIVITGGSPDPSLPPAGAHNLGRRRVRGVDYHFTARPRVAGLDRFELWAYGSHLFTAEEGRFDVEGRALPGGPIGDLAPNKAWAGATAARGGWTANVRGRWMSSRRTVSSNPVGRVDGYALADLFVRRRLGGGAGASLGLRVTNLFDETYYHPGVRDASAGLGPGPSAGYFNSLLPQPGREVSLVVTLER